MKQSNYPIISQLHNFYDSLSIHGADITAASTIDLDSATGNLVDVTGNTGITAITLSEGNERTVRFTGTPTITHGSSLVLPGATTITAAAGDFAIFRGYAGGVVRCNTYVKANGQPISLNNFDLTGTPTAPTASPGTNTTQLATTAFVTLASAPFKPNDTVYVLFTTFNATTGAAVNADSLPTAILNQNGTDTGVSITITNLDTGRYKCVFTIPGGYSAGDNINVSVAATVNSVASKAIILTAKLGA